MEDLNSRMPSLTDAEFNDLVKIIYDKTRIQMSDHILKFLTLPS